MERRAVHKGKVGAILTADWHLREDAPICRKDDFQKSQWTKVDFVRALQKKYDCPVLHAGDLFVYWKPSPYLLSLIIDHLPASFYTVYGNHDLPQHNIELAIKSGVYTLSSAGVVHILQGGHWGEQGLDKWKNGNMVVQQTSIFVGHLGVYAGREPYPGCVDAPARQLFGMFPGADLILTGHNHKSFVVYNEGRVLVNPGSLMRQSADQDEDHPRVYLWYPESNTVEPVFLPIVEDAVSREHIEQKQERDERLGAFILTLGKDWQAAMSFEQNLERFEQTNQVRRSVMEIVYAALEKQRI
jgi:DNA repair exonuclease SbcCD nuclease subunit